MRFAILPLALLAGCAPSLVGANEAGGIVNANFNMGQGKALALAQAHCQKYGKIARVSGQNEIRNNVTFECVSRAQTE